MTKGLPLDPRKFSSISLPVEKISVRSHIQIRGSWQYLASHEAVVLRVRISFTCCAHTELFSGAIPDPQQNLFSVLVFFSLIKDMLSRTRKSRPTISFSSIVCKVLYLAGRGNKRLSASGSAEIKMIGIWFLPGCHSVSEDI